MNHKLILASNFTTLLLSISLLLVMNSAVSKADDTQTLMIVGYDGKSWFPYIAKITKDKTIKSKDWNKIKTIRDPAYLTRQPVSGNLYIKGNDGRLYHYRSKNKLLKPLFSNDKEIKLNNYTQLRANQKGLTMVELIEGKSRDTRLVYADSNDRSPTSSPLMRSLLKQASAQFHPLLTDKSLFYAHVSCRAVCSPIIQEVWKQEKVTGKARQLTLLNATTYLHSVDNQERFGFISSNKRGYYHIAKLDLISNKVVWLTQGQVTDGYPSVSSNNDVYFIRRTPEGTKLMMVSSDKGNSKVKLHKITLPQGIKKIRYLELTN